MGVEAARSEEPVQKRWSGQKTAQRQPSLQWTVSTRIAGSSLNSSTVPAPATAKPQLLKGEPVWPELWGITPEQIKDLLARLRAEPSWSSSNNVHVLVHNYIVPWTQGTGHGYALSVNLETPKEVTVMVSHAWSENAEEFLETLLRSCSSEEVLFVCALSLYQPEDNAGPTIEEQLGEDPLESPFRRILEHIRVCGQAAGFLWRHQSLRHLMRALPGMCLCASVSLFFTPLVLWDCMALTNVCAFYDPGSSQEEDLYHWRRLPWWPVWTVLPACLLITAFSLCWVVSCQYKGRMLVALNREVDIYTRLWCVYEIFVAKHLGVPVEVARSLAAAGKVPCQLATCSSESDTERIRSEILATTTYKTIDKSVFIASHKAFWKVALCSVGVGTTIAMFDIIFGMTMPLHPTSGSLLWLIPTHTIFAYRTGASLSFVSLVVAGKSTAYFAMLSVFASAQGVPTLRVVKRRGQVMTAVGSVVLGLAILLCKTQETPGPLTTGISISGLIWMGYGAALWVYGHLLLHYAKQFRSSGGFWGIVAYWLSVFIFALIIHLYCAGLLSTALDTWETRAQLYRILVNATVVSYGSIFLPTYIFWYTAHWWGFQVVRETSETLKGKSSVATSDSESDSDSKSDSSTGS